jgi:hypothetical protein
VSGQGVVEGNVMSATVRPSQRSRRPTGTRVGIILGVLVAVSAFLVSPWVFEPAPEAPTPTGVQLPLFVLLAAIDAVVFGAGVFVAFAGRALIAPVFSTPGRATATHLALTWLLISWWLHDGLHMVVGLHLDHLLVIEYTFHVTLMAAAAVVVWTLARQARDRRRPPSGFTGGRPAAADQAEP